ncbi:uncharacterized protein MONBRDRAFT_28871 [Monosiga brevicollis MX1]|uniref:Mis18 domain-containing protein n=1 Tax=Monosiga brevicollis TaxID=81824 RepID=A9V9B0_MONBE|nr:uncharacterized protein MONBRDRAFT_28871 [Monosiga brevicollis MX1]EDQ85828.1 predicted protein [Monosiga brevicollis MX1]|eukprot:XP_001749307.1 hypothetical protein [Monosiga brevicollis MX1]
MRGAAARQSGSQERVEEGEGGQEGGGGQEEEIEAPLVFQCDGCRRIVGDSFNWVDSNQELNVITLSRAPESLRVMERMETSTQGPDLGSTYRYFLCACGMNLGRIYHTTPPQLDYLRGFYTYDLKALQSYTLGTGSPEQEVGQQASLLTRSIDELRNEVGEALQQHEEGLEELREAVLDLQARWERHETKRAPTSTPTATPSRRKHAKRT